MLRGLSLFRRDDIIICCSQRDISLLISTWRDPSVIASCALTSLTAEFQLREPDSEPRNEASVP